MTQSTEVSHKITMQAPVLFIPNALDIDFCRQLIHVWETEGTEESGILIEQNGKATKVFDYKQIIRQDYFLKEGETQDRLRSFMRDRVRPAIKKAFRFEVTQFEGFVIGCYDASRSGFIQPHRDDSTEQTAYRSWAMSLNLNVGEYEGGCLRFPEYGSDLYESETGCAAIFSSGLLHEVTPVTKGRRFVLLSFFYGEREAQLRKEYERRVMVS